MVKNILFVDDEPWFTQPLVEALRDDGYIVELAFDGTDAIEKFDQKDYLPDLVILDLIMPTGDKIQDTDGGRRTGLKVHEIIRNQLRLRMPIIFLSVVDDSKVEREIEAVERSLGIMSFNFLVKPVLPTELLDKVANLLKVE